MSTMRKFDAETTDQLKALGFEIDGDTHIALLRGDFIVSVVRAVHATAGVWPKRGYHPASGAGAAGPNSLMNRLVCTMAFPY
jgi:hypothetical protein